MNKIFHHHIPIQVLQCVPVLLGYPKSCTLQSRYYYYESGFLLFALVGALRLLIGVVEDCVEYRNTYNGSGLTQATFRMFGDLELRPSPFFPVSGKSYIA